MRHVPIAMVLRAVVVAVASLAPFVFSWDTSWIDKGCGSCRLGRGYNPSRCKYQKPMANSLSTNDQYNTFDVLEDIFPTQSVDTRWVLNYNSLCTSQCDGPGECPDYCGLGKCCQKGVVENGCDGMEGTDLNARRCVGRTHTSAPFTVYNGKISKHLMLVAANGPGKLYALATSPEKQHQQDTGETLFDSLFYAKPVSFVAAASSAASWMNNQNDNVNTANYVFCDANNTICSSSIDSATGRVLFSAAGDLVFQRITVPKDTPEYVYPTSWRSRSAFFQTDRKCLLTVSMDGNVTCVPMTLTKESITQETTFLTQPLWQHSYNAFTMYRKSGYSSSDTLYRKGQVWFASGSYMGRHGETGQKVFWENVARSKATLLTCPKYFSGDTEPEAGETDRRSYEHDWFKKRYAPQRKYVCTSFGCHWRTYHYYYQIYHTKRIPFMYGRLGVQPDLPRVGIAFKEREGVGTEGRYVPSEDNRYCFDNICESVYYYLIHMNLDIEARSASWIRGLGGGAGRGTFYIGEENTVFINSRGFPRFRTGDAYIVQLNSGGGPQYAGTVISPYLVKFTLPTTLTSMQRMYSLRGAVRYLYDCFRPESVDALTGKYEYYVQPRPGINNIRWVAGQCFALCERHESTDRVALNLQGNCICYEGNPWDTVQFSFSHCIDNQNNTNFFAWKFSTESYTTYFRYTLSIDFTNREDLSAPVVKTLSRATRDSFEVHFTEPTSANWGTTIADRTIEVRVVEVGFDEHSAVLPHCGNIDAARYESEDAHVLLWRGAQIASPLRVTNLKAMTFYCVSMAARTPARASTSLRWNQSIATVQPTAPSAPLNLYVTEVTDKSFRLTWLPPASTGGIYISNYTIRRTQLAENGCAFAALVSYSPVTSVVVMTDKDDQALKNYKVEVSATNRGKKTSLFSESLHVRVLTKSTDLYIDQDDSINDVLNQSSVYGQAVILRDGMEYVLERTVLMSIDGVQLRSENGSKHTHINLNGTRLHYADPQNHLYALHRIEGVTLTNGYGSGRSISPTFQHEHGGSLFFIQVHHTVLLKDVIFKAGTVNGVSMGGALAFVRSSGPFFITSCQFHGNVAGSNGGALAVMDGVDVQISDSVFLNNSASGDGGALFATNTFDAKGKRSLVTATSTAFRMNTAVLNGGAVAAEESDAAFIDSVFDTCLAAEGGAFFLARSSLRGTRLTLTGNTAVKSGGGIYSGASTIDMRSTNFTKNAAASGGGLHIVFSDASLHLAGFFENTATTGNGGGVFSSLKTSLQVFDSQFDANTAPTGEGGGIFVDENKILNIERSFITECSAHAGGGVSLSSMSAATISACEFRNCTATGLVGGGGVKSHDVNTVALSCSWFLGNKALLGGGGGVVWDFSTEKMSDESVESPIHVIPCDGRSRTSMFLENEASYGPHLASGGYALIQIGGPSQDTTTSFASADTDFGRTATFETTNAMQHPGSIIGTVGKVYPQFAVVDFYGNQVETGINDVVSISMEAMLVNTTDFTILNETREHLGRLVTAPSFTGTTKGALQKGVVTFYNLVLMGVPGGTYRGTLSSTRIRRVVSVMEIELIKCQPGQYIESNSEPICAPCQAGMASFTTNAVLCDDCPAGKYSLNGAFACKDCDAGKYQPLSRSFGCQLCAPNTVAPSMGSALCEMCPAGQYQEKMGSTKCELCAQGTFRDVPDSTCISCTPGKATNGSAGSKCISCPSGQFARAPQSHECEVCEAGQSTNEGEGSVECTKCLAGQFSSNTGSATCTFCKRGSFAEEHGAIICKPCSSGLYQPDTGSKDCKVCAKGFDTNRSKGASVCSPCAVGRYGDITVTEGAQCMDCPENTFSSSTEARECVSCPAYTWTKNKTGQKKCLACVDGERFGADKRCHRCPENYYSKTAGESLGMCHSCPNGAYCPGGSVILPKSGWWLSSGRMGTSCAFNASNLPPQCGRGDTVCNQDAASGEFYNSCGRKQRLLKCGYQRAGKEAETLGHICNNLPWENRTQDNQCLCNELECYRGKLCEECAPGFAKYGVYQCRKCVDKDFTLLIFILTFLGLMIAMGMYVRVLMETVGLSETTSSGVKIVMNALQMASLSAGFPLQWPTVVMNMFSTFGFASTASDGVLQLSCILDGFEVPVLYQKTIAFACLPFFVVSVTWSILTCSARLKKTPTLTTKHDHQALGRDHFDNYYKERSRKKLEKKRLLKEMHVLETRLAAHHKHHLRADKEIRYVPPLDKVAVKTLREAFAKAHNKGINIKLSVEHHYDEVHRVLDVRHCIQMLDEWDVGLSAQDLKQIQALLDEDGRCETVVHELLQYYHGDTDKFVLAISIVLYMIYPLLCRTAFSLLGCNHGLFHGDHASYLQADLSIPCYDVAHELMVSMVGMPMIIAYVLGFPVLTLIVLLRHAKRAGGMSDKVRYRYGLFTDGYKHSFIWWEGVVALRKAFVIAISVFMSTYGALQQVYAGIFVVNAYLVLHMLFKPYNTQLLNNLEAGGLLVCFVTLYAGMLFYQQRLFTPWLMVVTEIIVMMANTAYVFYCFFELVLDYALNISDDPRFIHIALKYHKASSCCTKMSNGNSIIERLENKLMDRVHESADEILLVNKFKSKMVKRGKTKVNPVLRAEATKEQTEKECVVSREDLKQVRVQYGASSPEYEAAMQKAIAKDKDLNMDAVLES